MIFFNTDMKIASVKNLVDHTLNQYASEEETPKREEPKKSKDSNDRCVTFSPVVSQRNYPGSESPVSSFSNDHAIYQEELKLDYMEPLGKSSQIVGNDGHNYKFVLKVLNWYCQKYNGPHVR